MDVLLLVSITLTVYFNTRVLLQFEDVKLFSWRLGTGRLFSALYMLHGHVSCELCSVVVCVGEMFLMWTVKLMEI